MILGLFLLEIYARIFLKINYFSKEGVAACFDEGIDSQYIIADENLGFLPGPTWKGDNGRYGFQNGSEYENSNGEQKNIIIIGDSIIQDRYLERSLKFLLQNESFAIWNAGVGGYNTLQEAIYLEDHIKITPDLLILGFCLNDFFLSMSVVSDNFKIKEMVRNLFEPLDYVNPYFFKHSALYRFIKLRCAFIAKKDLAWSEENVLGNPKTVIKGLSKMQEYCNQLGIPFIVVVFPHLLRDYSRSCDEWLAEAYQSILSILNRMNIRYIDIHQVYNGMDIEKLRDGPDDIVHPNLEAQFIVAKELINRFYPDFGITKQVADRIMQINFSQYEKNRDHD